jgi:hypothetical protein
LHGIKKDITLSSAKGQFVLALQVSLLQIINNETGATAYKSPNTTRNKSWKKTNNKTLLSAEANSGRPL